MALFALLCLPLFALGKPAVLPQNASEQKFRHMPGFFACCEGQIFCGATFREGSLLAIRPKQWPTYRSVDDTCHGDREADMAGCAFAFFVYLLV